MAMARGTREAAADSIPTKEQPLTYRAIFSVSAAAIATGIAATVVPDNSLPIIIFSFTASAAGLFAALTISDNIDKRGMDMTKKEFEVILPAFRYESWDDFSHVTFRVGAARETGGEREDRRPGKSPKCHCGHLSRNHYAGSSEPCSKCSCGSFEEKVE